MADVRKEFELPPLPEPYSVASTMKCVACGAPWIASRTIAWPHIGHIAPHACKCGSTTFGGTVSSENVSPAQFTADQMRAYAQAARRAALEAAVGFIQREINHAAMNDTRLPPDLSDMNGAPAVRVLYLEAIIDGLIALAAEAAQGKGE